ncbi:hypothetical protein ACFL00_01490 [Pseudomonadota bacterium]
MLQQDTAVYDVKGRNGWKIKQRIRFGEVQAGPVKRGWTKGYDYPFLVLSAAASALLLRSGLADHMVGEHVSQQFRLILGKWMGGSHFDHAMGWLNGRVWHVGAGINRRSMIIAAGNKANHHKCQKRRCDIAVFEFSEPRQGSLLHARCDVKS